MWVLGIAEDAHLERFGTAQSAKPDFRKIVGPGRSALQRDATEDKSYQRLEAFT